MDRQNRLRSPETIGVQPGTIYLGRDLLTTPLQKEAILHPGAGIDMTVPISHSWARIFENPNLVTDISTQSRLGQAFLDPEAITYNGNGHLDIRMVYWGEGSARIRRGTALELGVPYFFNEPQQGAQLTSTERLIYLEGREQNPTFRVPGGSFSTIPWDTIALPVSAYHPRVQDPGMIEPDKLAKGPNRKVLHKQLGYNGGVSLGELEHHPNLDRVARLAQTPTLVLPDDTTLIIAAGYNIKTEQLVEHTKSVALKDRRWDDKTNRPKGKYGHPIILEFKGGEATHALCYAFHTQRVA
jgi:hypothetical protein